jgi:hypothetical protein
MLSVQPEVPDSMGQEGAALTTRDQAILNSLLDPNITVELAVPTNIDPQDLYRNLSICIKAVNYLNRTSTRIKPLIGRMLKLIQDQPDVYKALGYKNFEDFLTKGVQERMGLSRSNLFECKQIATKWPSMTVEQYARIGATKLSIISRFTEEGGPMARRMLDKAEKLSVVELRTWAEEKKLIEAGESQAAVITIATNRTVANEWNEALNNPTVTAIVQSDKPGDIFRSMLQEALGTWLTVDQPVQDDDVCCVVELLDDAKAS